jgi:hypothetical protein
MLRVFVCTSQINALYMILYARKTFKEGYKDVLILDAVPKKKALIKVLINTKKIYNWVSIIDLSIPVADEDEVAPGLRKKITRKVKTNLLVKPFYDVLLKRHLKRKQQAEEVVLFEKLKTLGEVHEINLLTQTGINDALLNLYPKAQVNYFEHGLGDYFFIQKIKSHAFNFYCVFADTFKAYLKNKNLDNSYVYSFLDKQSFPEIAKEAIEADDEKERIISTLKIEEKKVILFLDAMEIYHVPDAYWTDYLDLCISKVENPKEYIFILKPHHNQTSRTIQISKNHMLNHHKLKTIVVENSLPVNFSIEVLNVLWNDSTDYVFSIFSSGLFYVSKLYGNPKIKHYYAYNFFGNYLKNAPVQFIDTYKGINELIQYVFSENCTDISPQQNKK